MSILTRKLMFGAGKEQLWVTRYYLSGINMQSFSITYGCMLSDDTIILGGKDIDSIKDPIVLAIDSEGNLIWDIALTDGQHVTSMQIYIDDSDNAYVSGHHANVGSATQGYVRKLEPVAGAVQWGFQYITQVTDGNSEHTTPVAIVGDGTSKIFMVGSYEDEQGTYTNGTALLGTVLDPANGNVLNVMDYDSSQNDIIHSAAYDGTNIITLETINPNTDLHIGSYNTSFASPSRAKLDSVAGSGALVLMVTSDGSILVFRGLSSDIYIYKINAALDTITWQKKIAGFSISKTVAQDSQGNIYLGGAYTDGSPADTLLKFNSAGSFLWGRKFTGAAIAGGFYTIDIDSVGYLRVVLLVDNTTTTKDEIWVFKLPPDGESLGTFTLDGVAVTYERLTTDPTVTNAANTISSAAASVSTGTVNKTTKSANADGAILSESLII